MRKNIFSWKSLAGLTLLFGLTMGLSSCEQVELGPNPSDPGDTKPAEPSYTDYDFVIWDVNGITTAKQVSDSLNLKKVTDAIAKKANVDRSKREAFKVMVVSDKLKVDATYAALTNTIKIPSIPDVTITLAFSDKFAKADGTLNIVDKEELKKEQALLDLNLVFADGQELAGLDVNMYAATVNVESAGTTKIGDLDVNVNHYGVYQGYNFTWGDRALTLGDGITVEAVDPARGFVIVGEGATVNALIVYNDEPGVSVVEGTAKGVENNGSVKQADGGYYNDRATEQYTFEAVKNPDKSIHYLHSVKVRNYTTGLDDACTTIWAYTPETPIETVTICSNANVYLKNVADHGDELDNEIKDVDHHVKGHSYVNNIVGLGYDAKGNALKTAQVSVGKIWYAFQDVKSVKNVTINNVHNHANEDVLDPNEPDVLRVYANLDDVNVNGFKNVYFFTTTQEVKKAVFDADTENVLFYVDAKNGATAYNFKYTGCELKNADAKIGVTDFDVESAVLDKDGNPVTYEVWHYVVYEQDEDDEWVKEDGEYKKKDDGNGHYVWETTTDGLEAVPLPARLEGNVWSHIVQAIESDIRIEDMTITVDLSGTKIGTAEIKAGSKYTNGKNPIVTVNNIRDLWPAYQYRAEMNYKYTFGSAELYRQTFDNTMGWWMFVTTK